MDKSKLIPVSWQKARLHTPFRAYGVAALAMVAGLFLRWLLDPILGDRLPFVTVFGAVAAAVWLTGYLSASLVAAIGYLACNYLFIEPRGSLDLSSTPILIGMLAFVFTCTIIIVFGEISRNAYRRAEMQRELLRTTLASIGDAVIATDAEGRIVNMNAVAESLTGWAVGAAIGRPLADVFRIVNERTRAAVENPVARVLAEGLIVGLANDTVLIAKDGTERPIDDSAAPIRWHDDEIVGCILIFRDITDRLRAEAELREADLRKNEFLAMLAHELRNPLTPIRNAVQVLKLTGGNAEAVQSASRMLERQVDQMARLVDDLLDVSRITRGRIELRRTRVELAAVVQDAVDAARSVVQSMNHELTVTIPPAPITLYADSARLTQIVGNLLNNASKFTERGGRIRLTVAREGGWAVIRVQDNGIGIASEQLSGIFDLFMQVDTSLERSASGLGIGLTLVKTLTELHGGTVDVHSEGLGRGSEFTVRLPIVAEPAPGSARPAGREPESATASPTAPATASPTARRVLIVDDNRDSASSLATLLQLTGNEARTAYDGAEAVKLAEQFRPDLVLLDIGLPKLNGYEVTRAIREQPWGKGMVVFALTGWGQDEDRQRSNAAGFDGHLVKPVDLAALTKLLAALPAPGPARRQ